MNPETNMRRQSDHRTSSKSDEELEGSAILPVEESKRRSLNRTSPLQNSDFVLEDKEKSSCVARMMSRLCVLDMQETGYPICFVSDGLLSLVGASKQKFLSRPWDTLVAGDEAREAMLEDLHSRSSVYRTVPIAATSEVQIEATICLTPIFDRHRSLLNYVMVVLTSEDLQEMQGVEQKIRDAVSSAVMTAEKVSTESIVMSTEAIEELTGFYQSELYKIPPIDFTGPDSYRQGATNNLDPDRRQSFSIKSILFYRKDGSPFWASVTRVPLIDIEGEPTSMRSILFISDVTSTTREKLNEYVLGQLIGNGASGTVRIAKSEQSGTSFAQSKASKLSSTGEIVAIKIVDASKFRSIKEIELVQDEISALSTVKHPNIINLREVIFSNNVFHFVMDFASGGSLASYLRSLSVRALEEAESKKTFRQIVDAVAYCHRRRLVHRDLKPENILIDTDGRIKVADFGLSAITAPCGSLSNVCGTPEFLAPEVIGSTEFDGAAADIWSLGIILYELLLGFTPFKASTRALLFKAIRHDSLPQMPDRLSPLCRDLVRRMLIKDPQRRITMEEILSHGWLTDLGDKASASKNETDTGDAVVHESAMIKIGDWDSGEDAISNAIVSGSCSRSPSVIIVKSSASLSEATRRLSEDLAKLRAADFDSTKKKKSKKGVRFFSKPS